MLAGYLYYLKSRLSTRYGTHLLLVCDKKDQKDLQTCLFFVFQKKKKRNIFLKIFKALRLEGFWDGARQLSLKEQQSLSL